MRFSQETLNALLADIEGREWRQMHNELVGIPFEHPRSSTTDDVECFFSILRDTIGANFTLKEVKYIWRKACVEMAKRLDPELFYYYYTALHDRFYKGEIPSFEVSVSPKTVRKPQHRELISSLVSGHATLQVSGSRSVKLQYHNLPVDITRHRASCI